MDNELRELYQQVILDHNKSPRNFKKLEDANHHAEGHNPLCGDHLDVYLQLENDVVKDISFIGNGCAISKSSASLMTAIIKGKTKDEAEELFGKFHDLVTGKLKNTNEIEALGKLAVFQGVQEFPARVKCASLAWHTLHNALNNKEEKISTE
ncbi:MAG: SUF system NifU family Fe-S cluster assembly protein [Ignavibacteria bacterium CG_4_8_14_3_um_filter_37_9]|nr:SUF system NifU family Fe-S cluster assembly protein [Ignavibacteria bacterium]OIO15647.1 MAG: SUF system NifU family Fe-S cluster assembly protein [Ignavibacteria bacterium CG1_02_37_35]PIS45162.1 MAG: SUF system NifU family Fe-S cluster assembly protein [Ignavibacteria bacterium CG08_land_8_20_14_0_20_37_9]PIW99103.1 MAG: SUF system NifU family Fe-S cluster assembly protein [Ignavibacteria bacterium CG_4_8_14_3_um_filter_37_9]PIX92975.1 MAG: SUF system NifU family Fe-S cluster assembly pro